MSELQNLLSSSSSSQQYQAVLSSSPPSFHTSNDTLIAKPLPSSMNDRIGGDQHQLVRRDSITRQSSSRTTKCRCQEQGRRKPWVERLGDLIHRFSASVELENTGSVARDHLANERTFLAWLRTSLSTISVGVGITQLFRLDRAVEHDPGLRTYGRPIGIMFILMAIFFVAFAFIRYFHSQTAMTKGFFPASRGIVIFTALSTFFALVALLIALLFKH